ncbi:hypothetical protein BAUCODRAFT_75521 [Baudoinia panamericana UAMH 10762]|uniref:Aspergillopepsin-2 n=1 Tax=Baudoinia panamericana (strain UAMH 10762) TaxID=717646 RepID=M2MAS4_BAUPA|nr:uncharacterized protein BAUCODRAFT_75521 [Baudoinia panamericana UAMH 10762]EMC93556.1 hypothetical protein BAUCODRAFT_75521 [Baudoinia panamericana UAMH 10762]
MEEKRHERLAKRLAGRRGNSLRPLAPNLVPGVNLTGLGDFISGNDNGDDSNTKQTVYSSNWAGAVIISSGITEVTGTFTVPSVSEPAGGSDSTEYGASAWVGIDGDTCGAAILQTGVECLVEGTETAYSAWYEWYPDYSYTFTDFDVAPGNVIRATVQATSTTSGVATLENQSTGQSVSHTFSDESSTGTLCETNAEWIVEDFQIGSSLVPFANFGSVTFTGASYQSNGASHGVTGATIFDVQQNGQTQTDCGTSGDSEVYCNYEG